MWKPLSPPSTPALLNKGVNCAHVLPLDTLIRSGAISPAPRKQDHSPPCRDCLFSRPDRLRSRWRSAGRPTGAGPVRGRPHVWNRGGDRLRPVRGCSLCRRRIRRCCPRRPRRPRLQMRGRWHVLHPRRDDRPLRRWLERLSGGGRLHPRPPAARLHGRRGRGRIAATAPAPLALPPESGLVLRPGRKPEG